MKFKLLPRRSESEHIAALAEPGEKNFVRLEIPSTGYGPIVISGRSTKSYTFRRDPGASGCHCLRIPLSLWMADNAAMAKDIMGKPGASIYKIIPLFEIAAEAVEEPAQPEEEPLQDSAPITPILSIPEFDPASLEEQPAPPQEEESQPVPMLMHNDDDFDIPEIPEVEDHEQPESQPQQPARRGRSKKA